MLRHRAAAAALAAVAVTIVGGCGQQTLDGQAQQAAPTLSPSGTATSTAPVSITPSAAPRTPSDPAAPRGPNGAPFDPCTIVNWADIATGGLANAGPDGPAGRASAPEPGGPRDGYLADCRFDNTIIEVPNPFDPNTDPNDHGGNTYWITHVLWDDACTGCISNAVLGRDGKVVLKDRPDTRAPSDQCVITAKIANGYATVSVFNERWKSIDPDTCGRATEILGHVVDRVS